MPSVTPDSRTISATSSVMSVTWRPPLVWKCRSAWKTFIARECNERLRSSVGARLGSRGPVAQRLEQGTHNSLVPGSNPGGPFQEEKVGPVPGLRRERPPDNAVLDRRAAAAPLLAPPEAPLAIDQPGPMWPHHQRQAARLSGPPLQA